MPNDTTPANGNVGVMRACALAVFVVGALVAAIAFSGLLPQGTESTMFLGAGLAAVTGTIGVQILGRCATLQDPDPARTTQVYVTGLAVNLGLQAVAVAVGLAVLGFSLQGEKFPALAAFGLSFAATAAVIQVSGALAISRFLHARARAAGAGSSPTDEPTKPSR